MLNKGSIVFIEEHIKRRISNVGILDFLEKFTKQSI